MQRSFEEPEFSQQKKLIEGILNEKAQELGVASCPSDLKWVYISDTEDFELWLDSQGDRKLAFPRLPDFRFLLIDRAVRSVVEAKIVKGLKRLCERRGRRIGFRGNSAS